MPAWPATPPTRPLPDPGAAQSAAAWRQFAIGTDTSSDTHDDFKPKYKQEPVSDAEATIKTDIAGHDVFVYMKVACRILCGTARQRGASGR